LASSSRIFRSCGETRSTSSTEPAKPRPHKYCQVRLTAVAAKFGFSEDTIQSARNSRDDLLAGISLSGSAVQRSLAVKVSFSVAGLMVGAGMAFACLAPPENSAAMPQKSVRFQSASG